MTFAKVKASSAARGYGAEHRRERDQRMTYVTPFDPCGYCYRPLGPPYGVDGAGKRTSLWHLPHNRSRTGYLPGMWHGSCNRIEGAVAGRSRQTTTARRL